MQFISSFFGLVGDSALMPNVFLFDSRDSTDVGQVTTLAQANVAARKTRSVLGLNGYLNQVRGQAGGKMYFTNLKYLIPVATQISLSTDIVSQFNSGALSGLCSSRDVQSYQLDVGATAVLFISEGATDTSLMSFPSVGLFGNNCPYTERCTVNVTYRTVSASGTAEVVSASASGIGYCGWSNSDRLITAGAAAAQTMHYPITCVASGGTLRPTPGSNPSNDGSAYRTQTGTDEALILDRAFCYVSAFSGLLKLDGVDFEPVSAVPGSRPRLRMKASYLNSL